MTFNKVKFEDELYAFVTTRVNDFFSAVLKDENKELPNEALKFQKQLLHAFHFVIEETLTQVFYGTCIYMGGK